MIDKKKAICFFALLLVGSILAISVFFVVNVRRESEERLDSLMEKVDSIDLSVLEEKQEHPAAEESTDANADVIILGEIELDETFGEAAVPQGGDGGNNAAAQPAPQPAAQQQSSGSADSGSSEGILHYNGSGEIVTPIMPMD